MAEIDDRSEPGPRAARDRPGKGAALLMDPPNGGGSRAVTAQHDQPVTSLDEVLDGLTRLDTLIDALNSGIQQMRAEALRAEEQREVLNTAARRMLRGQPDRAVIDGPCKTRWQILDGRVTRLERVDASELSATVAVPLPPWAEGPEVGACADPGSTRGTKAQTGKIAN